MATLFVTYWRDIPLLVTARDETDEVTVPLPPAFQELVDRVAVEAGLTASEAYLEDWGVGPPQEYAGPAAAAAAAWAQRLEAALPALRARHLGASGRTFPD
jgi:hypothetical protein